MVNSLNLQARNFVLHLYQALSKLPNLEYTQEMCSTVTDHVYYVISVFNTGVP